MPILTVQLFFFDWFQASNNKLLKKFDFLDGKIRTIDLQLIRMTRCRKYSDLATYVNEVKEANENNKNELNANKLNLLQNAKNLKNEASEIRKLKKSLNAFVQKVNGNSAN